MNIIRTFFVSIILFGGMILFGRDIYNLVICPIERMIEKVTEVIERPQKTSELAFIRQEEADMKLFQKKDFFDWGEEEEEEEKKKKNELETVVIETAIQKIGILLGIGLGEAGSGLIKNYLGSEGDVDILLPGQKTMCIFGFSDIRNFTDVTEILEEDIMVFVNKIAEIVHSLTDKYLGTANKNIGDAFLLVWKCPASIKDTMCINDMSDDEVLKTNITDLALFSFMKIFAEINRAPTLKTYILNQKIQNRKGLGPNYKVRLGSGLHYGWAIEGAIGSHHKVDASYLSPHVNISMDLEALTKLYGVPILLSGEFYDCLSDSVKNMCRKIDTIYNPGREEPLRIYSPNMSDKALSFPNCKPLMSVRTPLKDALSFKKLLERQILKGTLVGPKLFQNDQDIPLLTCYNDEHFLSKFHVAYLAYESGNWDMAKDYMESILEMNPKDGPSKRIFDFMKENVFEVPSGWKGIRSVK